MGFFSNISAKIFGHPVPAAVPAPAPVVKTEAAKPAPAVTPLPPPATPAPLPPAAPTPKASVIIDVAAVLDGFAAQTKEKLEWRKSIVDLMKLVGLDSGLAARKELASELNYPGSTKDSAAMNTWLHKAVIKKLAENGGKVPAELLD